MNRHVAHGASLILLRLVMKRGDRRRTGINRKGMAIETHQVDLAAREQAGIGRTMRRMASGAAFDLYGLMLVDKRSGLFRMALEANRILLGSRP